MLTRILSGLFANENKKNLVSIILVSNAFVWYFCVIATLEKVLRSNPSTLVWIVHFSALILSALVGASLGKRWNHSKFLIVWMLIGTASSLMLFAFDSVPELVSIILGLSLGVGMPTCASYFSESIKVENRGRMSGITFLASGIGMVTFGLTSGIGLFWVGIILASWRLSGLMVFLYARDYRRMERNGNAPSFKELLGQHSFILYFIPWLMFSLVNYLATPKLDPKVYEALYLGPIQTGFMGVAAVLGGFFLDSIGRKRIAIAGFVLLGLGAAVLGFSGGILSEIPYSLLYFNAIIDGIAWGFLFVLFVLTVWGDVSHSFLPEKFYALGVMPFFLSKLLDLTVKQSILELTNSNAALFSFTAFFLFLAVLPLVYAPETLPEKIIKNREMTIYLQKAQQIVKRTQKKAKELDEDYEKTGLEFEIGQEELEKAEELTEEYY